MKVFKPNFKRTIGEFPNLAIAVVQHAHTGEILMVAFTDEAGWLQTLQTGNVSLFSTSRGKSWVKGEESGNFMKVLSIMVDCDGDAIIYSVEPQGPGVACHTGAVSCFYREAFTPEYDHPPKEGEHEHLEMIDVEVHERFQT